jgi:hypothetical protein
LVSFVQKEGFFAGAASIRETRIEQVYAKVGEFWLPLSNRSSSTIRLGGHAYFTIDYRDYQITAANPLGLPRKVTASR